MDHVLDLSTLESRYADFCEGQGVSPNSAILSAFLKAKLLKSRHEQCNLQVSLDKLRDADLLPLMSLFSIIDSSEIDLVDILHGSLCILEGEKVLSLISALNQKLRIVDLCDSPLGKDDLRDLFHNGLTCKDLKLRSSHIRKLDMVGNFSQLQTLNLDFSISLTGFQENCFICMPNLMHISMCETRVSNLWTSSAALSKLPSLVELRFQNCVCCDDTGPCSSSSSEAPSVIVSNTTHMDHLGMHSTGRPSITNEDILLGNLQYNFREGRFRNLFVDVRTMSNEPLEYTTEESSDDSDDDFSRQQHRMMLDNVLSNMFPELSTRTVSEIEGTSYLPFSAEGASAYNSRHSVWGADAARKKYVPHHPSPICFEKHYREYMIVALPRLKVLDNLPVCETDRELANLICAQYYEFLPYSRQCKQNVASILQKREKGSMVDHLRQSTNMKQQAYLCKSPYCFSRSISAAKVDSSAWPLVYPVPTLSSTENDENNKFRPRQFEYHPSDSSLLVFGTLDGELVVINHESGKVVRYTSSGALNSVLGLCWLKSYPTKLIAGSDNGSLQLYDIRQMPRSVTERQSAATITKFDDFEQLTSVHVNSTDEKFIASGYSKNVSLYDIESGKKLQTFTGIHHGHINVVKFAHQAPSVFVTSSFDKNVKMWDLRQRPLKPCYTASSSRGNVMVCFSPDDHYLLTSAVDNEVNQLLAADGRVSLKFQIAPSGSSQNYTRSYYINGRDYIISGSSDEHVVRICCAQTGRRLRDVPVEARDTGTSMFVQSLRGDPFRDFHLSVLAAYMRPMSKSGIFKVNLMATRELEDEYTCCRNYGPSSCKGA